MKTLTLRLSDIEADMLDRLATVYGMSKNSLLNMLLTDKYEYLDKAALSVKGEAIDIAADTDFGHMVYERFCMERNTDKMSGSDFLICKRALEYSLAACPDTEEGKHEAEELKNRLSYLMDELYNDNVTS